MDKTWVRQSLRLPLSLKPFLENEENRSQAIINALESYFGVAGGGDRFCYLEERLSVIEKHLGIEPPPPPEPAKPEPQEPKPRRAKAKKSPPDTQTSPPAEVEESPLDGQDLPAPAEVEEPASEEIPPPPPAEDTTGEEPASEEISPPAAKLERIEWDKFLEDFPDKTIANLEELTTIACERYPDRKVNSLRESLRTKLKKLAKRK